MKKTNHKSGESISSGSYRQLGAIHLHVDGGQQRQLVERIVSAYGSTHGGKYGSLHGGKLHHVLCAIAGPQRQYLPEVYASHTPGASGTEQFAFFLTIPLASREEAIDAVRRIYPTILPYPDIVIELERVVMTSNTTHALEATCWEGYPFDSASHRTSRLTPAEVPFQQAHTLPIEIHHGINIPKGVPQDGKIADHPPLELAQLLDASQKLGMQVGGWFLFDKGSAWAYRSNEFTTTDDYREKIMKQNERLHDHLHRLGLSYELWSIAEQVLGLWRTPVSCVPHGVGNAGNRR